MLTMNKNGRFRKVKKVAKAWCKFKVKSLNMNKRAANTKGCITSLYVKRPATGATDLEQFPADSGWIFNDPNQDAVITRRTDCHTGALCAEHPGICWLVLFMVPVPQVWHSIWLRSPRGEGRWQKQHTHQCLL